MQEKYRLSRIVASEGERTEKCMADKQSMQKVASATEGTESGNVRAKATEKGSLYHFYCPSPLPPHPPRVESMQRKIYGIQPSEGS